MPIKTLLVAIQLSPPVALPVSDKAKNIMADEIKCPVCGKVGIPDYNAEDTVCPQCGSDLSIFRVIDQIPQKAGGKINVWMPIAAVAIVAAAVLGGILINRQSVVTANNDELVAQVTLLQDSINKLNSQIPSPVVHTEAPNTSGFKYVVKNGDSFWSISRRFYHTGTRYEEVAVANGLDSKSKIVVGDTLIIKK